MEFVTGHTKDVNAFVPNVGDEEGATQAATRQIALESVPNGCRVEGEGWGHQ